MARSDVLVSADGAESNLDTAGVVFVEVDEDTSAYDTGHVPGAIRLDWRSDEELAKLYADAGLDGTKETIAYCRSGERSSHTRFVLRELLGHKNVTNYDGSWTEYGSLVGAPIELGS
ncbi:thiosulfate sulfurtransferase [Mycobacterium europaeum]|uniref:Sulfurtransferase n=1 Tax=Mycobacterium europaeum TaxID=761804 RepID=A0A0U1CXH2_9MYCO|nr:rhodanese-like domain-containing protein [Mycobacterium europaeum]CQD03976.1 thiosulfate sulfurtransferase [Mycobacterium europaeum]